MTHIQEIKHLMLTSSHIALSHFTHLKKSDIHTKSRYERVTSVDYSIDKLLRRELPKIFGAPVLSEEHVQKWKPTKTFWVIDPLDGTTNYYSSIPFFGIGIGLVIDGVLAINAISNPIMHELFFAERGKGAYLNDVRLQHGKKISLKESIIGISYAHEQSSIKRAGAIGLKLREVVHNTRHAGSSLLTLAYVACGRLQAAVLVGPVTLWDSLPALLLIEEIGGRITDFNGKPYQWNKTQNIIISNATEHNKIIDIIKRVKA